MNKVSINQVLENPELLNHDNYWSFYDWFCSDRTLERRAKRFISKLKFLKKLGLVDGDKMYVWFKNNCPMCGGTYDDMRISTLDEDNKFCGGLCPKTGHEMVELKAELWWFDGDREIQSIKATNWSDLKKTLKNQPDLIEHIKRNWRENAIH
jgi:hypothetical protein